MASLGAVMMIETCFIKNAKLFCLRRHFGTTIMYLKASSVAENVSFKYENKSSLDSINAFKPTPIDFNSVDTVNAYKSKSIYDLIRALTVLKLTSYDFLVENHAKVTKKTLANYE